MRAALPTVARVVQPRLVHATARDHPTLSMFGELWKDSLDADAVGDLADGEGRPKTFDTRRMHALQLGRVFSPSRIFAHTLIESPGRNSGRLAWRRCDFSMDSRIRCALMGTVSGKSRWDAGFCQRSTPRVKPPDPSPNNFLMIVSEAV
jgi:hypothetical protein